MLFRLAVRDGSVAWWIVHWTTIPMNPGSNLKNLIYLGPYKLIWRGEPQAESDFVITLCLKLVSWYFEPVVLQKEITSQIGKRTPAKLPGFSCQIDRGTPA